VNDKGWEERNTLRTINRRKANKIGHILRRKCLLKHIVKRKIGKGKAVPLQTWSGSEVSRKLRFPNIMTTAQDGGKFVSLTHRSHLPPENTPGTHFC